MKTKLPTGQRLADGCARMMGFVPECSSDASDWWIDPVTRKRFMQMDLWEPHLLYEDCRIVEDWIWENGLMDRYIGFLVGLDETYSQFSEKHRTMWTEDAQERLWQLGSFALARSTPLQRCQAALLAYQESKKKGKV